MSGDFDIEAYSSQFSGQGKSRRLLFIASQTAGQLQRQAYKLALDELQKGLDVKLYQDTVAAAEKAKVSGIKLDSDWVSRKELEVATQEVSLEQQLKTNKSNILTDEIRRSYQDLGHFMYAKGYPQEALKYYARAKDFCTQGKHVVSCSLNAIVVSLSVGNTMNVTNQILMAEQTPELKDDAPANAKLDAAAGLAHLEQRSYKTAARKFTAVTGGSSLDWDDVISPQEVALYGALCGLASYNRDELRSDIIDNISFREFLDTFPQVRELVNDFFNSQYTTCLKALENLETRLRLDLWLHRHIKDLCKAVRSKALVQYTSPFSTVSLTKMAAAFSTNQKSLEEEIVRLIQKGEIAARIDSLNQVLHKKKPNAKALAYQKALLAGEEYVRSTRALLIRGSIQRYNMAQVGKPGGKHRGFQGQSGLAAGFLAGPSHAMEPPPGLAHGPEAAGEPDEFADDEDGSIDDGEPPGLGDPDVIMQEEDTDLLDGEDTMALD